MNHLNRITLFLFDHPTVTVKNGAYQVALMEHLDTNVHLQILPETDRGKSPSFFLKRQRRTAPAATAWSDQLPGGVRTR
jgi:hypothetical protein